MAAVSDHQLAVRLPGGGDHRFRLRRGGGHRLFAHHMLAGLAGADRIFGVHRVRQHDVHDVDVRVVPDRVVSRIAVAMRLGDAVFGAVALQFPGRAADQRHQLRMIAILELRHDLAGGIAAETDDSIAELALGGAGSSHGWHGSAGKARADPRQHRSPVPVPHDLSPACTRTVALSEPRRDMKRWRCGTGETGRASRRALPPSLMATATIVSPPGSAFRR